MHFKKIVQLLYLQFIIIFKKTGTCIKINTVDGASCIIMLNLQKNIVYTKSCVRVWKVMYQLLAIVYSSCLQGCGIFRFILIHPTIIT